MAVMALIPVLLALLQVTLADLLLEKTAAPRSSGQLNLAPTLEEPSSSWLLQEDDIDAPPSINPIANEVLKRPTLPNIPDVLILTLAALTLGVSVLLRELCRGGRDQKHQQLLISVTKNEATDAFGCTELHVAAAEGSALNVRKLLEGGSNPNAREAWEETPLHMAARNGNVQVAQLLVSHGADVNPRNLDDLTPLILAAQEGKQELCSFLLDAGASAGGMEEEKLPCLLNSLLMQRILSGTEKAKAT